MTAVTALAVTSEIYPFVKTGGLADVTGALPLALRRHGVTTVTLVPGYPAVMAAIARSDRVLSLDDLFGGSAQVLHARSAGLDLLVLDAPHLFNRPGNPYSAPDGGDWPDNAFRFGALSFVAARIALGDVAGFVPDIVHGHDWQAGLAMAYLAYQEQRRPATVLTVHNLAYQGQFPADLFGATAAAAACVLDRRRRELRHDRLSEGRPAVRRSHHHGVADLRARDPGLRPTAAASTACCGRARPP